MQVVSYKGKYPTCRWTSEYGRWKTRNSLSSGSGCLSYLASQREIPIAHGRGAIWNELSFE